jgi:hypothetical protein
MEEYIIGLKSEYFCKTCGQLRGSYNKTPYMCGNCGSTNVIAGKVNELNKEELKAQYSKKETPT